MGWFDDQIKERIRNDNAAFSDAFASLADTVMDKRLSRALTDSRTQTKNAIDEILSYYGEKSRVLPDNISEADEQLEYLMHPIGIMRRNIYLKDMWYKDSIGAILTVRADDNSPVALIPTGFSGYSFIDKKTGKNTKITKKNAGLIGTEAICFYRPLPTRKLTMKDLYKYMIASVSGKNVFALVMTGITVTLLGLLLPTLNSIIYKDVIVSKNYAFLLSVFAFFMSVGISQILISAVQRLLAAGIGTKVSTSAHNAIMMRLLTLPASFFKKRGAGETASGAINIGVHISNMVNAFCTLGVSSLLSLLYIIGMARYGQGMVLPAAAVLAFGIAFSVISTISEIKATNKLNKESEIEEGFTYSMITGIQKIKLSGSEKRAFTKWAERFKEVSQIKNNMPLVVRLRLPVDRCIPLVGMLVTYYFAIKTNVNMPDFFAFQSAFGLVMGAFVSVNEISGYYASAKSGMEAIKPILEAQPEIETTKTAVSRLMGGIEINNLSFRYTEDMPYVLDNLSLKIRPGQYVAIVGESGCGKSTLMRLLMGFEKPNRGAIYYDGKDMASFDLKSLRKNIGTVMQNEKLFAGDIFSNITISAPHLTPDEAFAAAEMAGIAEDICSMPMGMHTIISEGSGGISGGQRQRLIIARAIAGKPRILMFDEATSALDNVTQKTVSDSLERLKCTRIVIAHRLSTIKNCDRIIVLDKGRIIEDGKYDELMEKDGFFAELVKRQQI